MLKVFVYGSRKFPVVQKCLKLIESRDDVELEEVLENADVAVAPFLTKILTVEVIEKPRLETLVCHPSLLPLRRVRDAIRRSFFFQDNVSGASWFWADEGIDTGSICEQVVLPIESGDTPRSFYNEKVIPACVKMLGDIFDDLSCGVVRRIEQNEMFASYDKRFCDKVVRDVLIKR